MPNALEAVVFAGKTVGYRRISTDDQNAARQLDGIALHKVFTDETSGKDTDRPQLAACLDYLREDDTLVVDSIDRLARNLIDLHRLVTDLTNRGVTIRFVHENLTFSPNGNSIFDKLILSVLGAFAEFERNMMLERQRAGIRKAKERGVYKGRKPTLGKKRKQELFDMIDAKTPKAQAARHFGISVQTVRNYLKERQ